MADKTVGVPVRALYGIPEARRLVPAEAISAYVALLLSEAGSDRDRAA